MCIHHPLFEEPLHTTVACGSPLLSFFFVLRESLPTCSVYVLVCMCIYSLNNPFCPFTRRRAVSGAWAGGQAEASRPSTGSMGGGGG